MCRAIGDSPSCSCVQEFIGSPPNCKPECVSNTECAYNLACINQKCKDPCPGLCGANAECRVISHSALCVCSAGFIGDPFTQCRMPQTPPMDIINPCQPSPCGSNAICREQNGAGSCQCIVEYIGNPYEGCRPECSLNSDCPSNRACINNRCQDPCPGTCGQNAECHVVNHLASCTCLNGFSGDPYRLCTFVSRDRKCDIHSNITLYLVLNNSFEQLHLRYTSILANLRHADLTASARKLTNRPCARVCPNSLATRQVVAQNAQLIPSVPTTKPALT